MKKYKKELIEMYNEFFPSIFIDFIQKPVSKCTLFGKIIVYPICLIIIAIVIIMLLTIMPIVLIFVAYEKEIKTFFKVIYNLIKKLCIKENFKYEIILSKNNIDKGEKDLAI